MWGWNGKQQPALIQDITDKHSDSVHRMGAKGDFAVRVHVKWDAGEMRVFHPPGFCPFYLTSIVSGPSPGLRQHEESQIFLSTNRMRKPHKGRRYQDCTEKENASLMSAVDKEIDCNCVFLYFATAYVGHVPLKKKRFVISMWSSWLNKG